jgi:radical SAM protein with 4Fe4S-binding SPASM domain
MNLIVVDKCTNYCGYCFAATEMAATQKKTVLSKDSIDEVIRFIERSGPGFHLNIIGGEPFLFHDMDYLLDRLVSEPNFAAATIFTGGIAAPSNIEKIARFANCISLLVNLNEKRDYKRVADYALVVKNIALAQRLGIQVTIGFNIWRLDFDFEEILDVCTRFGVEHLRWTVAYPELTPMPGVSVVHPSDYGALARRCYAMLERAFGLGIEAHIDCPLPKCFFTPQELGRILLTHPMSATPIRACGPAIDVTPDLSVFRCFALSGHARGRLPDFASMTELTAWYEANVDDRYAVPSVFESCAECEFARNRTCYGGCMAHSPAALHKRRPEKELKESAFAALQSGRVEDARALIAEMPHQDSTAALLTAYSYQSDGDFKQAEQWARRAVNRARTDLARRTASKLLVALEQINCDQHIETHRSTSADLLDR